MLLLNVLLALAWTALAGSFGVVDFAFGFALGALALFITRRQVPGGDRYFGRLSGTVHFAAYVVWELILANVKVARTVLFTRAADLRPGIVAVPIDLKSDAEITTLANLITLTPGTLSLDVSDDRKVLYVHAIEVDEPERFRADIKRGFERAVREVFE